jgi:hypothetical protein
VVALFAVKLLSVLTSLIWPFVRRAFRKEPALDPMSE